MKNLRGLDSYRRHLDGYMGDDTCGMFELELEGSMLTFRVIASSEGGWEHVSVSTENRCPKWSEMCQIKEMFFYDTETVMQLHVPKEEHINIHPYCLHLWRPLGKDIPLPPSIMVGWK
ncbi:MAG: hypothetical protein RR370_02610 [Synergistaceae bacterium]